MLLIFGAIVNDVFLVLYQCVTVRTSRMISDCMYHYRKLEEKYPNVLRFKGIQFPVKVQDIKKFCGMNNNISINVYLYEDNKIFPHALHSEKEKEKITLIYS